jgi:primosomal protein N' (replication factor Y) (superfamily II helicase)
VPGQRSVRVRTDVAALPKLFDYAVPEAWTDTVTVGTRVRVLLHGRRVGGWVVENDVTPPAGVSLQPLSRWSGWGPPPAVVELTEWAAWRWAGPASFFLRVASPANLVRALPTPPAGTPAAAEIPPPVADMVRDALEGDALLRLPPTTDLIDVVLAVVNERGSDGTILVLVPSSGWAMRLTGRLRRRGYQATMDWAESRAGWPIVVGSRAASWAPVPHLGAAVILDAHDESYREQSAPTYSAVHVLAERARRQGVPCLLTSPVPPTILSVGRRVREPARAVERDGWAALECVDRRGADPRSGLFSEAFVGLAHAVLDAGDGGPLVCVYNRTGGARLLACAHCGEIAQCTRCTAAMRKVDEHLACPRCGEERPMVCAACGRLKMKTLRAGVTRLREEVSALLGAEVAEVSGPAAGQEEPVPDAPVLIGTEAVLHRVRRAAAVVFLDIDLHLLAPRVSATDETLALLVRASRLVGARHSGPASARIQAQTRVPQHPLLRAIVAGDPAAVLEGEEEMRRSAGLPPFAALAALSGPLADGYAAEVRAAGQGRQVTVAALTGGLHLVRAAEHGALCDVLAEVARPSGRGLRVEVDPAAI